MAKKNAKKGKPSPRAKQADHVFMKDSAWSQVMDETGQLWELRKGLIGRIQRRLRGTVIVYFSSFFDEKGMMTDMDAEMIEGMLAVEHTGGKIILILNSAGGSGLAAERIVNVCRSYSNNNFEVIVPHMAKSAATLICFGASLIHMSPTAELGPVDPQVEYMNETMGRKEWISAQEYIRSYEKLMTKATSGKAARIETLVQQLARYDARFIEQLRSAQNLSVDISLKLLKSGMLARFTDETIKDKMGPFLLQERTQSHGRMISMIEAKNYGLKIKEIKLRSPLWNWLWELYTRANWVVSTRSAKILESARSAVVS